MFAKCRLRASSVGPLLTCLLLIGCATGAPELITYSEAFNIQQVQAFSILDDVAAAERKLVARIDERHQTNDIADFDPDRSLYYVLSYDPPITGMIRSALKSVAAYNDALVSLVTGEATTALLTRIRTFGDSIETAAASSSAVIPYNTALVGVKYLSDYLSTISGTLKPIINLRARSVARDSLLDAYPHVDQLLIALRSSTPAMFEIVKRSKAERGNPLNPSGLTPDGILLLEQERRRFSGWVVLLDKVREALALAVSVASGSASEADVVQLNRETVKLRVLSEQLKSDRAL